MSLGMLKLVKRISFCIVLIGAFCYADINNVDASKEAKLSTVFDKKGQIDKNKLSDFDFDIIKKGITDSNTLLIVGGIQGDEPGGFMAASLISTHYEIEKGSVWIIPNLNFYSIIKSGRGPFGDMNRKFSSLDKNDPEYEIVERIKHYIADENVKLILNLHDGSGFYRPMFVNKNYQPLKWGQTIVIDQELLHDVKHYNDLHTIAKDVVDHTNKYLLNQRDMYRIKNTHTRFKRTLEEQEMAKTLTYYAISQGKSAFGHETSKSLSVNARVYYKLLSIEKFMDIMGIKYKRKFDMSLEGINKAITEDVELVFDGTHIKLPLKNIRDIQKYFPVDKDGIVKYFPSNPLIKIIKQSNTYTIYYGNKILTKLEADYRDHLNFTTEVDVVVDGVKQNVKLGDTVDVKSNILVKSDDRFRVNAIGYTNKSGIETDKTIFLKDFDGNYSIEKNGTIFRIEFYKDNKFAGMILVNYIK